MSTKRSLLSVTDLSPEDTGAIVRRAIELKSAPAGDAGQVLRGKSVALLFEKPSLRTKVSFMVGIQELGGYSLYLGPEEVGLGAREPASDVARVLSGYVDCIVARVNSHRSLEELAEYASIPVINALSDWEHPCQIMADLVTVAEHQGDLAGRKLAFIGDGNNVARSLCLALPAVGMNFVIASPNGYNLDAPTLQQAQERAQERRNVPGHKPGSNRRNSSATATATRRRKSGLCKTRQKRFRGPTWSILTCGPVWATRRKEGAGWRLSRVIRWIPPCWLRPSPPLILCTICPPTMGKRFPPECWNILNLSPTLRRTTGSTPKRRSWNT